MERRASLATAGPWDSRIEGRDHLGGADVITTAGEDLYVHGATHADQDFIANARQDIPRLVGEIRRLHAALNERGKA
ncbi:MAG: hypothetical protein KIT43_00560 [Bauldia sp.]|nr:hypothetical protein [Bauldia sp.]